MPSYDCRSALSLASELRELRRASGLTQGEMASRMGVNQSRVARLESDAHEPTLRSLERYAEALGVTIHWTIE